MTRGMQGILKITEETTEGTEADQRVDRTADQARRRAAQLGRGLQGLRALARTGASDQARIARSASDRLRAERLIRGQPKPQPSSTWARCPGCRARSTRRCARGLEALAAFRAESRARRRRSSTRAHTSTRRRARSRWSASTRSSRYTDEARAPARAARGTVDAADRAGGCDVDRSRVPQAADLPRTSSSTARPPVPLKLYPEYERCSMARGVKAAAPTDLFYPDLDAARPAHRAARSDLAQLKLPSYLVKQRRLYQRGLLSWLRGDEAARKAMRDAIAGIEDSDDARRACARSGGRSARCSRRSSSGGLEPGFGRQAAGGAASTCRFAASPRAARRSPTGCGAKCSITWRSARRSGRRSGGAARVPAVGTDPVAPQCSTPTSCRISRCCARRASSWRAPRMRGSRPRRAARRTCRSSSRRWRRCTRRRAEISNGALMKLTAALVERLDKMPAAGVSEPLAMEYATALLLAESAFENYSSLAPDFPRAGRARCSRGSTRRAPAAPRRHQRAPMLDEMIEARAGARAARAGRAARSRREPAPHGTGAGRVFPRQHEARASSRRSPGQPADPRRAAGAGSVRRRSPARRCARSRSSATRIRRRRQPTTISSSSPNRCRASGSSSRRSSSNVPIASA